MDHLVFASPDLTDGVEYIEQRLGVEMSPGGRHLGFGTRNRLIGFGPDCYMEVVSVDPDQPDPAGPRWFGLSDLKEMRLVTWCAKASDLSGLVATGRQAGIDLGELSEGGRVRPDGSALSWTVTDPWADRAGGVIPFFIDWGDTAHPGTHLPSVCSLVGVRVEHPEPDIVRGWFQALGLDTSVSGGESPRVIATLNTPNGTVDLA
ncbi:MAG: VOC family protein [Longimicrobiales bacterium]|jgi:hypothetical protein